MRRRRRRRNPGGLGLALGLAVVAGVGYAVYEHVKPTGLKAKIGDVVTVPFAAVKTDAPVPLDALGGTAVRLQVTALGEMMKGKPPGAPAVAALEVPFARSGVVLIERGGERIT